MGSRTQDNFARILPLNGRRPAAPATRKYTVQEVHLWYWLAFGGLVVALLSLDLFVLHGRPRERSLWRAAAATAFWCLLALAFNLLMWRWRGHDAGMQFLTGYLLEWSLSMDNVFVFAVILRYFRVPPGYQHRVLFWGVLGAIFTRLTFILAGAALVHQFEWLLGLFGLFLVYTAVKLARPAGGDYDPADSLILRLSRRFFRMAQGDHREHGAHFFVREEGHWCMTPMFVVLLVIESTDVLFSVDSVPAIFGISKDAFVIFTSNVFAVLGLRALYFLLVGTMDRFHYLHYGLAAVLGFVGLKMVAQWVVGHELMPTWGSLVVIVAILGVTVVASLVGGRRAQ
jgi:tellurite resistance protein TerC